jgi:hypothetical protein
VAAQLTSHLTDSPCAHNSLYSDQRLVKHSVAVISGGLPQLKGFFTAESRIHYQDNSCGIDVTHSVTGTGFPYK